MAVLAGKPSDEFTNVEFQKEERSGEGDSVKAEESAWGFGYRPHGVEVAPGGERAGRRVVAQTDVGNNHLE